jgi:hypothetical protein
MSDPAASTSDSERPPGYVARCSLRGAGSSQSEDDAPIERPIGWPRWLATPRPASTYRIGQTIVAAPSPAAASHATGPC